MKIKISSQKRNSINKGMMGLFFEDINYAADGGLYAEMLENRNFNFVKAAGDYADYYVTPAGDYAWSMLNESGTFNIVSGSSLSKENPYYARLQADKPGFGISNKAYEGITVKEGESYNLVIWARPVKSTGSIKVCFKDGDEIAGETVIPYDSFIDEKYNFWKLYSASVKADKSMRKGKFELSLDTPGVLELAYVSLIPGDAVMGIFRKDIYTLLKELKPGFIRFPGGCIVEGNTLQNRYDFKNTLKPTWERKTNWNRWAVHGNNKENNFTSDYAYYNQTYGLGFYEYFLLCESIGAKPLPVLNVGLACQYQSKEFVKRDSKEYKEFLQDALDLIEFANGSADTKWGALRLEMGHKEPFNLELLGIGNEQWQTEKIDFFERYLDFEKAIHEKYPNIKLIGSAGPDITSERYTMAWDFYRKNNSKPDFAYALDEHYYVAPEYLFDNNSFYDDYSRDIKVFAGEYAAHPFDGFNRPDSNNLWGALSEAAFLTGVERNADVVRLASYAPLFARVGYAQWSPDMIWFNDEKVYGTPSYYVQKLYSNNMGDFNLISSDTKDFIKEGIYFNVSFDLGTDETIVKIVNSNEKEVNIDVEPEALKEGKITLQTLSGKHKEDYNSCENPLNVSVTASSLDCLKDITLKPLSFNVLRFS